MDLSGPRYPGRYPDDAPESYPIRPQYFLCASYRVFTDFEQQQRQENEDFAQKCLDDIPPLERAVRVDAKLPEGSGRRKDPGSVDDETAEKSRVIYFARFLESKHSSETIPAIEDIVNEVNCMFKCKAVFRIHADRAKELTGDRVKSYFRDKGVRVTDTAGYDPNSNPRAEGAIGLVKTRARVMLSGMGPEARELWPAAVQHACWSLRHGADARKRVVPAFGDPITVKIKLTPSDGFAPRGKEAVFLGCLENVTHGILVGNYVDGEWVLETSSSYTLHGSIDYPVNAYNQEEFDAYHSGERNAIDQEESTTDNGGRSKHSERSGGLTLVQNSEKCRLVEIPSRRRQQKVRERANVKFPTTNPRTRMKRPKSSQSLKTLQIHSWAPLASYRTGMPRAQGA